MYTAEDVKKALEKYTVGITTNAAVGIDTAADVRKELQPYGEIPEYYIRSAYRQAAREQAQTAQSGGAGYAVKDSDAYAALLKRRQNEQVQPTPLPYAPQPTPLPYAPQPKPLPYAFREIPRYQTPQEIPFNSLQSGQTADTMGNTGTTPEQAARAGVTEGVGNQSINKWAKAFYFAKGYVDKTLEISNDPNEPWNMGRQDPFTAFQESLNFYQTVGDLAQSLASGKITAKDLTVMIGKNVKEGLIGDILYIKDNAHLFDPNANITKEQAQELGYRTLGAVFQLEKIGFTIYSLGRTIKEYLPAKTGLLSEGAGETKLYRVMSDAEYDSIVKNGGKFSDYDYAMAEKWFATSPESAAKWGKEFYRDGNYKMIEIEVPTDVLGKMYHVENLDGYGSAYSGGIDFLNSILKGLKLR